MAGWQNDGVVPHAVAWLVALLHLGVIALFFAGGPLAARYRRLVVPHLAVSAAVIGVFALGWACPLTEMEKALRRAGGASVYDGGFIDHYLTGPALGTPVTATVRVVALTLFVVATVVGYGSIVRTRGAALVRR